MTRHARYAQHAAARRKRQGHAPRRHRQMTHFAANGVFLLLGLSVVGLVAAVGLALANLPTGAAHSSAQIDASASKHTSIAAGSQVWIPLRSTAPADLIAAAQQSTLFAQNRSGTGDHVADLTHLGTPVFVRPLRRETARHIRLSDFYVLPILNARGEATDAAELELDADHTAIHVVAIITYAQPHAQGAISRMTAESAVALVVANHGVHLRNGAQAQLIYFPLDAEQQQTGKLVWKSGGEFPGDPLWLVPGTDGQDHIAGNDGAVYFSSQIPWS